ncbi:MAG: hypothetical protein AAGC93_08585 [Cyanobacteria bacterium P01_F01_bin.53]
MTHHDADYRKVNNALQHSLTLFGIPLNLLVGAGCWGIVPFLLHLSGFSFKWALLLFLWCALSWGILAWSYGGGYRLLAILFSNLPKGLWLRGPCRYQPLLSRRRDNP